MSDRSVIVGPPTAVGRSRPRSTPRFRWPPVIVTILAIVGLRGRRGIGGRPPGSSSSPAWSPCSSGWPRSIRPEVATLVVIFLLYSNAAVIAVTRFGAPVFVGAVVPMILVVPLGYELLIRRRPIIITPAFPWIVRLPARPDPRHAVRPRHDRGDRRAGDVPARGDRALPPRGQRRSHPIGPAQRGLDPDRRRGLPRRAVGVPGDHRDVLERLPRVRPERLDQRSSGSRSRA